MTPPHDSIYANVRYFFHTYRLKKEDDPRRPLSLIAPSKKAAQSFNNRLRLFTPRRKSPKRGSTFHPCQEVIHLFFRFT